MIAVKSTISHAEFIADHMRQQDISELNKLGSTPLEALIEGLSGDECFTLLVDKEPVMMFGMNEHGFYSAVVWALGTDEIFKHKKEFIRQSIMWRDSYLKDYSILFNHVDIENSQSIRWLSWLGAIFHKPYAYGTGQFMRFEFQCVK